MIIEKNIRSVDEVFKINIKYHFVDFRGFRTEQWIMIDRRNYGEEYDQYSLNYHLYTHQLYNFETIGSNVRLWKTFAGAKRFFIRKYTSYLDLIEEK